jgi:hypothetical protein
MLERLFEFRSVLNAMMSTVYPTRNEDGNPFNYKLPSLNFDEIESIIEALKPLAGLTKQLSSKDAWVSDILRIYYVFMKRWPLDSLFKNDKIGDLRQKITAGLDKRMGDMKTDP